MQGERYYFYMEGSMQSETEPMRGDIETNIGKLRNSEGRVEGVGIRLADI